jgi:hypothetical protein
MQMYAMEKYGECVVKGMDHAANLSSGILSG